MRADGALITRFLIETFFCGLYSLLFAAVIYLKLVRSRIRVTPENQLARWVLVGLVVQFVLTAAHWGDTIFKVYYTMIDLGGGAAVAVFFGDPSRPTSILQIVLYVLSMWITDILVINRLYVIFSWRPYVIVAPLILLLGQVVSGAGLISVFVTTKPGSQAITILALDILSNGWVTSTLVLSIAISLYSTVAISWRIWGIHRSLANGLSHGNNESRLTFFLAVLLESAALQTATAIATLLTFQLGLIGQAIVQPISPVVFAISTVLIHLRIGLGWAHEPQSQRDSIVLGPSARITFAATTHSRSNDLAMEIVRDGDHALGVYSSRKVSPAI